MALHGLSSDTSRQKELRERRGLERPYPLPSPAQGRCLCGLRAMGSEWGSDNLAHKLPRFKPNSTKDLAISDQLKLQKEPQSARYYLCDIGQAN